MWQTRREFLKTTAAGGATVLVSRLAPEGILAPAAEAAVMDPPDQWSGSPGVANYRIDGLAKVTGQKIYARDFLPQDMPGWPTEFRHALVLCSPFADRIFEGVNLDALPDDGRPQVVVTGEDLERDGIGIADEEYPAGKYLVKRGMRPDYLGKPVAILLFDDRMAFQQARRILVYQRKGIRAGKKVEVPDLGYYPESSIIHVVGKDGKSQKFAQTLGGRVHPEEPGARNARAMEYIEEISRRFEDSDWSVYEQSYSTQMVDPMFMEPENGLAWFNRDSKSVELLIGSQSPGYDVADVKQILEPSKLGVENTHIYCAYPGGGFGGRDTSILCLYLGLAAAYSDKPIRILHDRFQQFQQGVKRHSSEIQLKLGVDDENRFQALRNATTLNGGGRINVSKYVGDVAGIMGAGAYRFRWADIYSRPQRTQSLVAGSMRGFGATQATFAIESMIDEIADARGMDAIDLRLENVLAPNEEITTGAPVAPPGMAEMLKEAKAHELWAGRDAAREASRNEPHAYGVGFALSMKNYGSGADAADAVVEITPEGKLKIVTSAVDMGQGLATALAVSTAQSLGRNADEIDTGVVGKFDALQQVGGFKLQPDNPRWTPILQNSTKASSGSSRWVHPVLQASRILLEAGIVPAARTLWGNAARGVRGPDVGWEDGALVAPGLPPIPFSELVRVIHDKSLLSGVMVHAFFSAKWISAEFTVEGLTRRWDVDGMALRHGDKPEWDLLDRRDPHLFTVESMWEGNGQTFGAAAALAAVRVDRKTGEPKVVAGVQLSGPGKVIVPELVAGQLEGSWAMGIGQALLEYLPPFVDGGSSGKWNLNQYHVPLVDDCAIDTTQHILLPPESPHVPARGMGEVNLNCVAPAVANAVAHATRSRFRDLPITAEKIRRAWS